MVGQTKSAEEANVMTTTKVRTIIAALAATFSVAVSVAPAQASSGTLDNGVCWSASRQWGSFGGVSGSMRITLSCRPNVYGDYVATKYNVRFQWGSTQHTQFERTDGQGANYFFAEPGQTVYVQGCRKRYLTSICQSWSALEVR
jgi:hypothetical protein